MRNVVSAAAMSVVLGGVSIAFAEPDWCKGQEKPWGSGDLKDAIESSDPTRALPNLVIVSCWPDADAKAKASELEASRAKWMKALDLTEADWKDVVLWALSGSQGGDDFSVDYETKYAWSTLTPTDQFAGILRGFPNNGAGNDYTWYTYVVDALGTKLTETGRLAYILQCTDPRHSVVELAICAPDIARLDRKKVAEELRNDTSRTHVERMIVRLRLHRLGERLKEYEEAVKKAKAKDPVYAKMFEISDATRREWDGLWKSEAAALDLMLAMDDVRQTSSRKLKEGCEAKMWAAFKAAVGKVQAKRFEGFSLDIADSWLAPAMGVVASSPQGWLALAAYNTCHNAEDPLGSTIGSVIAFLPGYRGPRLATHAAIMNAGLELDDTSAKIEYPNVDFRAKFGSTGMGARGWFATVAKVSAKGDKAVVSFKPKLEKQEQCASRKSTNRIQQITSSGEVIYESICLKWTRVTVDRSPDPQTVDKRYVEGVKPGMNVMISSPIVMAAWQKGKKAPSFVSGVSVK